MENIVLLVKEKEGVVVMKIAMELKNVDTLKVKSFTIYNFGLCSLKFSSS